MSILDTARRIIGRNASNASVIQPPAKGYQWEDCLTALERDPNISDEDFAAVMGRRNNILPAANSSLVQSYRDAAEIEVRRRTLPRPAPAAAAPAASPAAEEMIEGQSTTVWESTGQQTATMTMEELTARRLARVANARMGMGLHDRFLLFIKSLWRVIGPVWFVAVTAGEVVDYLNHYMPHSDLMTNILIWGVALFLEISMMVATYDLSGRNRIESEKRAAGIAISQADRRKKHQAIFFWSLLAGANIAGQIAFLWFVTHPIGITVEAGAQIWLIGFVVIRVLGMLVGDANTAFVLGDDEPELNQVARTEKQRGEAFALIAEAEGDQRRMVAEANLKVAQVDSQVERIKQEIENQKRRDAYHNELDQIMIEESLSRQRQRQLPSPQDEQDHNSLP